MESVTLLSQGVLGSSWEAISREWGWHYRDVLVWTGWLL